MYEYFAALIIGIVEGLTEYIPVSSTGHMIIVGDMIGFSGTKESVFEVFIQLGAILSVLLIYRDKFKMMLRRENWFKKRGTSCYNLVCAMLPAMAIGYLTHHFIKTYLFGWQTVVIGLILGGILMLFAERVNIRTRTDDVDAITTKQAVLIGVFQVLSLWPGFSRSGSTISGGLLLGISRKAAADFSFIMAAPLMFVACTYDLLKIWRYLHWSDFGIFALGFVTAAVVAYASVLWFLKFLNNSSLASFAYYRFALAVVTCLYFWF